MKKTSKESLAEVGFGPTTSEIKIQQTIMFYFSDITNPLQIRKRCVHQIMNWFDYWLICHLVINYWKDICWKLYQNDSSAFLLNLFILVICFHCAFIESENWDKLNCKWWTTIKILIVHAFSSSTRNFIGLLVKFIQDACVLFASTCTARRG